MNTTIKDWITIGKMVDNGDKEEIITYIGKLQSRIADLDLQLRQIYNCCEITKERNTDLLTK